MNKAVLSLGAASLVLAGTTIYLARTVAKESAASPVASSTEASPTTAGRSGAGKRAAASRGGAGSNGSSAETPAESSTTDSAQTTEAAKPWSPEAYQKLMDAETEAAKRDPQLRHELIEERIPIIRDQYLPLQRRLKVDNERWQRFMEVLAGHDLGYFAALADCKKSRNCEQPDISQDQYAQQRQEIVDVLGDAHTAAFEAYRNSGNERFGIRQIQAELPEDAQIPEDRAEDLVQALAKTRMEVEAEMSSREKNVGRFYQMNGALLYDKDLPTAESRVEDAARYSRRLRAQAAKFLQGRQLAAFNRQQDRLLQLLRDTQDSSKVKPAGG
jgi:hypothetical protein